jgi:hypothetical protein
MTFIHRWRVTDLNLFAVYLTAMSVLEESDNKWDSNRRVLSRILYAKIMVSLSQRINWSETKLMFPRSEIMERSNKYNKGRGENTGICALSQYLNLISYLLWNLRHNEN